MGGRLGTRGSTGHPFSVRQPARHFLKPQGQCPCPHLMAEETGWAVCLGSPWSLALVSGGSSFPPHSYLQDLASSGPLCCSCLICSLPCTRPSSFLVLTCLSSWAASLLLLYTSRALPQARHWPPTLPSFPPSLPSGLYYRVALFMRLSLFPRFGASRLPTQPRTLHTPLPAPHFLLRCLTTVKCATCLPYLFIAFLC